MADMDRVRNGIDVTSLEEGPRRVTERTFSLAAAQLARTPDIDLVEDQPLADDWRQVRWDQVIPNRFRWANRADLRPGPHTGALLGWADCTEHPLPNLILWGPTGTGKTYAAITAARAHFDRGLEVGFWPVVELLDGLRPGGDPDLWERLVYKTSILVVDDLGTSKATDWADERLFALVNRRWLDERATVVTTNLDPNGKLAEVLGDRMWSRLCGNDALILGIGGEDRRLP